MGSTEAWATLAAILVFGRWIEPTLRLRTYTLTAFSVLVLAFGYLTYVEQGADVNLGAKHNENTVPLPWEN